MKLFSYLTLALALTLTAVGCKNSDNSSSNKGPDSTAQADKTPKKGDFKAEVTMLKDSTDAYWNSIQAMTEQKYKDIDRLLLEISYTEKPNMIAVTKYREKLKEVSAVKFDPHTMLSDDITKQDSEEDTLVANVFRLASKTEGIESHPIVNTLSADITAANNTLLIPYRARYDYFAAQLNEVIEKDKKKLDKLGAPYNTWTKYQLFTLPR